MWCAVLTADEFKYMTVLKKFAGPRCGVHQSPGLADTTMHTRYTPYLHTGIWTIYELCSMCLPYITNIYAIKHMGPSLCKHML